MVVMQVKMTDMQVRGTPRDMLSGDPHCAPLPAVLAEAYISLLRKLSITDTWSREVNDYVLSSFFLYIVLLNNSDKTRHRFHVCTSS
jgi:hypothetical protein